MLKHNPFIFLNWKLRQIMVDISTKHQTPKLNVGGEVLHYIALTLSILVWNRVWFSRELRECSERICRFNSKWIRDNASKMRIQNGFQEIFLLTFSNLSNDGIISAFARCENGWGNWHFLVWNRGQDLENRAAQPPPRIPRSTPRLPGKLRPCRFIRVYEFTSPSDPEKSL